MDLFNWVRHLYIQTAFPIAIALALGIWWSTTSFLSTPFFIICLCIILLLATKKTYYSKIIFIIVAFFAGATTCFVQQRNQKKMQKSFCAKKCSIHGTVTSFGRSKKPFLNNIITVAVHSIKNEQWKPLQGMIQIYTNKKGGLQVGDETIFSDLCFKKQKNGTFNLYLLKQGIIATTFKANIDYTLVARKKINIKRFIFNQKQKLYQQLKKKLSSKTFSLFSSIFLGNKQGNPYKTEKAKEQFKSWGILHFLARSGLHLVICVLLWEFIFGFLPLPFFVAQIILATIVILYCCLSWISVSFIRALSVFLLCKLSPLLNKRSHFIHTLSIVALFMLLFNPVQLFFLDFQLSFLLTYSLAMFGSLQQKRLLSKDC